MNTLTETPPIKIAVFGLSCRSIEQLQRLFKEHANSRFVVSDEKDAEAAMVDLDGFGAPELWLRKQVQYPEWPFIVLSLYSRVEQSSLFVQKPLEIDALLHALRKVRRILQPAIAEQEEAAALADDDGEAFSNVMAAERLYEDKTLCQQFPDHPLLSLTKQSAIYYQTENYLHEQLMRAWRTHNKSAQVIRLALLENELFMLTATRRVFHALSNKQLRSLSGHPLEKPSENVEILTEQEFKQRLQKARINYQYEDFDSFLWKITVWGARGRIPQGLSLDAPIALLHWPNATRMMLTPHSLQIAALWRKQPRSLLDTLHILQIPQCALFAFYSAAFATGLAKPLPVKQKPPSTSEGARKVSHSAQTLFNSILSHLRRKQT